MRVGSVSAPIAPSAATEVADVLVAGWRLD
jgi:hypothetical protein